MSTAEKTIQDVRALEGPPVLVGRPDDRALTESLLAPVLGPTRKGWVLLLLAALAAYLTAGIGNIASARGIELTEVESTIEGDIDLNGILGLSDEVRNGFEQVRVNFTIRGDAPEAKLREIVEQSRARSAVFDVLTNGTEVSVTANATST